MRWTKFTLSDLKWYECLWAAWPVGLVAVGGAIGGACGGAACALNLRLMQSERGRARKYALTGLVSLGSVAAYIVLARVAIMTFGLGGMSVEQADRELQKSPILVALQKVEPETYTKIRTAVIDESTHGKSQAEVTATVNGYLVSVVAKYLPIASDDSIIQMTRVLTLEIDQVGAKSADACFRFLHHPAGASSVDLTQYATPEVLRADSAATSAILESGIASPQRIPAKSEVDPALSRLGQQLVASFGAADVAGLADPATIDHARYCTIASAVYKQALSMPRAEAVPLLRYLFGQRAA